MSSLLVVEPHSEGHHMHYTRWIVREAAFQGREVWLATAGPALEHPAYRELERECGRQLRTVLLPAAEDKPRTYGPLDTARLEFHYHRMFSKLYQGLDRKPDYAFVPFVDYCLRAAAVAGSPFGSTPWGGLALDQVFHLERMGVKGPGSRMRPVNERLFFRLLADHSLRTLFTFDESLVRYTRRIRPKLAGRLQFVPEPAELRGSVSRTEARKLLGIPQEATVLLVYGVLDHTKGIDALLKSTEQEAFPDEVALLLAGHQDPSIKRLLSSPRADTLRQAGRFYERDEHLYGEDEHTVFQAADLVWVGYQGQFVSSGVLIQAAMKGLPLVACDAGVIGWLTHQHGMGLVVDVSDPTAVAAAIRRLARDAELSSRLGENGRRYARRHDVESFSRAIGEGIERSFPTDR